MAGIRGGDGRHRAPQRQASQPVERHRHPLHTVGNIFFAAGLGVLFLLAAFLAIALQSAILEF